MPIPKVNPARALSIPVPSFSGERDDDSALGILIASILGSASPGIGSALAGILFKDEDQKTGDPSRTQAMRDMLIADLAQGEQLRTGDEYRQEARFNELVDQYSGVPGTSEIEAEEIAQRILALEGSDLYGPEPSALPTKKGWKRRGLEGAVNLIAGGLAAAAGGEKGATAFVTSLGATQKAQGVRDVAARKAVTDREADRRKAVEAQVTEVLKEPAGTWANAYAVSEKGNPYQRRVRSSWKGTEAYSEGDPEIDVSLSGKFVPKGRTYLNPSLLVMRPEDEKPVPIPTLFNAGDMGTAGVQLREGQRVLRLNPETGLRELHTEVRIGGEWVDVADKAQLPKRWLDLTALGDAAKPLVDNLLDKKEVKAATEWIDAAEKDDLLSSGFNLGLKVVELAHDFNPDGTDGPGRAAFASGLGAVAGFTNNLLNDVNALAVLYDNKRFQFSSTAQGGSEGRRGDGTRAKQLYEAYLRWGEDGFQNEGSGFDAFTEALTAFEKRGDLSGVTRPSFIENLEKVTGDRLVLLAAQLQMAYMAAAAAGQTGRTLSDRDLAYFLQIVGHKATSDPDIAASAVMNWMDDTIKKRDSVSLFRQLYGQDKEKRMGNLVKIYGGDPNNSNDLVMDSNMLGRWGVFFVWDEEAYEDEDGNPKPGYRFKKLEERFSDLDYLKPLFGRGGYLEQFQTGSGDIFSRVGGRIVKKRVDPTTLPTRSGTSLLEQAIK